MTDVARSNWACSSMGSRSCAACETRRTSCAANASAPTSAVPAGWGWSMGAPPPTDGAASDNACPFQANERRTAAAGTRNNWFSKLRPSACLAEREQVAAWGNLHSLGASRPAGCLPTPSCRGELPGRCRPASIAGQSRRLVHRRCRPPGCVGCSDPCPRGAGVARTRVARGGRAGPWKRSTAGRHRPALDPSLTTLPRQAASRGIAGRLA